jgi:Glycerophosphoryl diester phosphodiesterase
MNYCLSIAHRGYSSEYGDNNLRSFQEAVKHSFDMIELDLQLSKDNQIIIYHDPHLKGVSINEFTCEQLQDMGVLTLEELVTNIDNQLIKFNLELKGTHTLLPLLVMTFLEKHKLKTSQIYLSSFNYQYVLKLKELRDQYQFKFQIGLISCNHYSPEIRSQLLSNIDFFVLDYESLCQEIVNYCHQHQILLFVFTNYNDFSYQFICKYDVDGIISNTKFWVN